MSDEPQLTSPAATPSRTHRSPRHEPVPPPALPPDDPLEHPRHGLTLRASRPPEVFVPLRRWVLDSATQLRAMRAGLREQLAASAPLVGAGGESTTPDNVVLVASELATNALAHGHPPAEVRLLATGPDVLVVVSDRDATHAPFLAEGREPGEGGFGLQIARRLSADVGWWIDASGKHVWATFEGQPHS